MANCPNINLPEWKSLVESKGDTLAHYLWDKYNGEVPQDVYMSQTVPSIPGSKASPKTVRLIKDIIGRLGIEIETFPLEWLKVEGKDTKWAGVADLMERLIGLVEGREDIAITEELSHFVIAIIKEKDPALFKALYNKIGGYKMYSVVKASPEYQKKYKKSDGSLDIPKLKEEAMGKILAEYIIKEVEQRASDVEDLITDFSEAEGKDLRNWWQKALDFIKNLFNRVFEGKVDVLYQELAMSTLRDRLPGTAEDITEGTAFFSLGEESLFNKLKTDKNKISTDKQGTPYYGDTKASYSFSPKVDEDNKRAKFFNQVSKDGHSDIQEILKRFINEEGYLRENPLPQLAPSLLAPEAQNVYNLMYSVIEDKLSKFEEGTQFIPGATAYSQKNNKVATADLLAINPDGRVSILNFDFVSFSENRNKDIPQFQREQMQERIMSMKNILKGAYGADFSTTRSVPIMINFQYDSGTYKLRSIKMQNKNMDVVPDYLKELPTSDELTGDPKVDKIIEKLNSLQEKIKTEKAPEGRKDIKRTELNNIFSAIRHLQISRNFSPLFEQIENILLTTEAILETVNKSLSSGEEFDIQREREIATELNNLEEYLDIYRNIDIYFKGYFGEDEVDNQNKVKELGQEARLAYDELKDIRSKFAENFIAKKFKIVGIPVPEKVYKGIPRQLRTLSQAPLEALKVLYKMTERVRNLTDFQTKEKIDTLLAIREEVKQAGLSKEQVNALLLKKDKNLLVDEFSAEFYSELQDAIERKDIQWIKDNIDTEAFENWAKEFQKNRLEQIESYTTWEDSEDSLVGNTTKDQWREEVMRQTNLKDKFAWLKYENVRRFPLKEKWESSEFKNLKATPSVYKLYNYIREINKLATQEGYLDYSRQRNFLPFLRKTWTERLLDGQGLSVKNDVLAAITVDENVKGYGVINPRTGELEDTIPVYFTREVENPSDDIFKNIAIFTQTVIDYNNKKEFEQQAKLIYFVEKNKQSLQTDFFSNIIRDAAGDPQTIETNEPNAALFKTYLRHTFYGQRFPQSDVTDFLLGKVGTGYNKFAASVNKVTGMNLIKELPPELAERNLSVTRLIENMNRFFQMKVLGLNLGSAISQYMGGNFQAFIKAGEFYNLKEWATAEWKMSGAYKLNNDPKLTLGVVKALMPLTEGEMYNWLKELPLSKVNQYSVGDMLTILMRKADNIVQYTHFLAMVENAVVIDNQLVNARKYLRSTPKYANKYTSGNLAQIESEFEGDLEKLIEEKGFLKQLKLKDDKVVFPENIDMESVYEYRSMIQQTSKTLTGNISPNDEPLARLNIIGKSALVFKGWVLRPFDDRFSEMRYDAGTDKYEYGRVRQMAKMILQETGVNISKLIAVTKANEGGIETMRSLYNKTKEAYEKRTNKTFKMTEAEFFDMTRQNISSTLKDTILSILLLSIFIAAKASKPDDDEDVQTKTWYKYQLRTLDKITDELTFYYNPVQLQSIVGGSIFPALGVFTDTFKVIKAISEEGFGFVFQDEEMQESAKPTKYIMKSFPITKEMTTYIALFAPDMAKELGISISTESRIR